MCLLHVCIIVLVFYKLTDVTDILSFLASYHIYMSRLASLFYVLPYCNLNSFYMFLVCLAEYRHGEDNRASGIFLSSFCSFALNMLS